MRERITTWSDPRGEIVQVAVAWLDNAWEPLGEVTEQVGPFQHPRECIQMARDSLGRLGVGQLEMEV